MEAVVQKWGNSLGLRIPNLIARELLLKNGSVVDISGNGKEIIIKPLQKKTLSEMLDAVNEKNIHEEVNWGKPAGKEVW